MAQQYPPKLERFLDSPLAACLVLVLAVLIRMFKLAEWSMWEDEEGTVYFSQNLYKAFPSFFPIFFWALNGLYRLTGVSVVAGRALSASFAFLSLVLLYFCFRQLLPRRVVVLAVFLLAINLGHVFWSQSIRYYNLLVVFQLLSMYWFLIGFERGNFFFLLLSNIAFVLGLWTHFSCVLLAPVYMFYLFLAIWRRETDGSYKFVGYLVFGLLLVLILGQFAWQLFQVQRMLGDSSIIPSARDPLHVLITLVAYFGLPLIVLGVLGLFLAPCSVPPRLRWFFAVAGILPVLELLVIAQMHVINVTWYYALFALSMFAILAGFSLSALLERGYYVVTVLIIGGVLLYYGGLLAGYYTTMYGDRPRWKEAAQYLRQAVPISQVEGDHPQIFSNVPGVVAFYLGVNPGQTMGHPLVKGLPELPPAEEPPEDQWYVIEDDHISKPYKAWLQKGSHLKATFEAWTGPRSRTLRIYQQFPESDKTQQSPRSNSNFGN